MIVGQFSKTSLVHLSDHESPSKDLFLFFFFVVQYHFQKKRGGTCLHNKLIKHILVPREKKFSRERVNVGHLFSLINRQIN